jgi:hypothetical protein
MANTDFSADATTAAYKGGLHSFANRITFTPVAGEVHTLFTIPKGSRVLLAGLKVTTGSVGTGSGVTASLGISGTAAGYIAASSVLAAAEDTLVTGVGAFLGGTDIQIPLAADTPVTTTIALSSGTVSEVTVEFEVQFLKLGMAA